MTERRWTAEDYDREGWLLGSKILEFEELRSMFRQAAETERAFAARLAQPDDTSKIAIAELAGYRDGVEGLPANSYPSSGDDRDAMLAYDLWFIKGRSIRTQFCETQRALEKVISSQSARLAQEARTSETAEDAAEPTGHGYTCPKVTHGSGGGYLHDANDDRAYDVDGIWYCGRCHGWIGWTAKDRRTP